MTLFTLFTIALQLPVPQGETRTPTLPRDIKCSQSSAITREGSAAETGTRSLFLSPPLIVPYSAPEVFFSLCLSPFYSMSLSLTLALTLTLTPTLPLCRLQYAVDTRDTRCRHCPFGHYNVKEENRSPNAVLKIKKPTLLRAVGTKRVTRGICSSISRKVSVTV